MSQSRRNTKARNKIVKKEEKKEKHVGKSSDIIELENNDTQKNGSIESSVKIIDGREAVINKRARQLLAKEDIINNRKAYVEKAAKEFLKKIDNNEKVEGFAETGRSQFLEEDKININGVINGRKVKLLRRAKKQDSGNVSLKTKSKVLTDKQNNLLLTRTEQQNNREFNIQMALPHPVLIKHSLGKYSEIEDNQSENQDSNEFTLQMALPHPMLMKQREEKSPRLEGTHSDNQKSSHFNIQMALPHPMLLKPESDVESRVPYYTAFIKSKAQARKNRERLSGNLL